jgi:hypothetical protein
MTIPYLDKLNRSGVARSSTVERLFRKQGPS